MLDGWASTLGRSSKQCHWGNMGIGIPSGEHTKSNGKWPCIVDFPIKNGDVPLQNVSSPEGRSKSGTQKWMIRTVQDEKWPTSSNIIHSGLEIWAPMWAMFIISNGPAHNLQRSRLIRLIISHKNSPSYQGFPRIVDDSNSNPSKKHQG